MLDLGSPVRAKILDANPHAYELLVVDDPTPPLARELLGNVRPEQLISGPNSPLSAGQAALAGLWLWHDGLEECHHIAQGSPEQRFRSTFNFWHAIMHRREGDFSNSKYWYARTENHPTLQAMANQAGTIINPAPADNSLLRLIANGWNANAFVDLVHTVYQDKSDPRHRVTVQLQQLEWRLLFDHCVTLGN